MNEEAMRPEPQPQPQPQRPRYRMSDQVKPPTQKQLDALKGIHPGLTEEQLKGIDRDHAWRMIRDHVVASKTAPATPKQRRSLCAWGLWKDGMTKSQAHRLVAAVKGRTASLSPEEAEEAMRRSRAAAKGEPGTPVLSPTEVNELLNDNDTREKP